MTVQSTVPVKVDLRPLVDPGPLQVEGVEVREVADLDVVRTRVELRDSIPLRVPERDLELRPDGAEELRLLGLNGPAVRRPEEGSDSDARWPGRRLGSFAAPYARPPGSDCLL